MPIIESDLCKGCELCIEFCPRGVFVKSANANKSGYYVPRVAKAHACTGCGLCELLCPDFAISADADGKSKDKRTLRPKETGNTTKNKHRCQNK